MNNESSDKKINPYEAPDLPAEGRVDTRRPNTSSVANKIRFLLFIPALQGEVVTEEKTPPDILRWAHRMREEYYSARQTSEFVLDRISNIGYQTDTEGTKTGTWYEAQWRLNFVNENHRGTTPHRTEFLVDEKTGRLKTMREFSYSEYLGKQISGAETEYEYADLTEAQQNSILMHMQRLAGLFEDNAQIHSSDITFSSPVQSIKSSKGSSGDLEVKHSSEVIVRLPNPIKFQVLDRYVVSTDTFRFTLEDEDQCIHYKALKSSEKKR